MQPVRPLFPLTPAELRIAEMVGHVDDLTNKEIARRLGISPNTVRNYIGHIAAKLPGRIPAKLRIQLWMRGAPDYVLIPELRRPADVPPQRSSALALR